MKLIGGVQMDNKKYTSGEIASLSGLTVRTIQYYDNIGLLPSTGRTEGGRRYYNQEDLIQIEQIIFYKLLDFPLEQIKEKLIINPTENELLDILNEQSLMLLQKMEHLHTSFATIEVISKMIETGRKPPFSILIKFLSSLPGDDIFSIAPQIIAEENPTLFNYFEDVESTKVFYHNWKEIMIESVILLNQGIQYDDIVAQDLAKRWWQTILLYTNGNVELIEQISTLGIEEQLNTKNLDILNSASEFLGQALETYLTENHVFEEENEEICVGGSEDDTSK